MTDQFRWKAYSELKSAFRQDGFDDAGWEFPCQSTKEMDDLFETGPDRVWFGSERFTLRYGGVSNFYRTV